MRKAVTFFFAMLALFFSASAVFLAFRFRHAAPVLMSVSEEAELRAESVMEAFCSGNFAEAQTMLYGTPDLDADREPDDPVGALLWQAYVDRLDYELVGRVYATDTGLAQDVKIISMELTTVTERLAERTRELLQQRLDAAEAVSEDLSEIYDENNEYRSELVGEIMQQAAREALEEDTRYSYRNITLRLVYSQGQWWITPDETLLSAISGVIPK